MSHDDSFSLGVYQVTEALRSPEKGAVNSALSQKQFPLIIDEEEDLSNLYTSVVLQKSDLPLL